MDNVQRSAFDKWFRRQWYKAGAMRRHRGMGADFTRRVKKWPLKKHLITVTLSETDFEMSNEQEAQGPEKSLMIGRGCAKRDCM